MGAAVLVFVFLAIASCWMVVRDTGMEKDRVIISLTEDELFDAIENFKVLKPMMQNIVRKANGSDTKQGTKDAVELGHDFDVAIEAMTMLAVNIQKGE